MPTFSPVEPTCTPTRLALVFLACLVALTYFHRPPRNPNENSRMAPVLAAFWRHTLSIDAFHARGPTITSDKSAREGHVYSDKAPGSSFLAAVGYAPLYAWERLTGHEASYLWRKWTMTVAAVAVPLAAALAALFWLAASAAGPRAAAGATAVGLLATPLLPFGSSLFGHALAGALLLLAFAVIRRAAERPGPIRWQDLAAAGALLGLTAATEFPAAPAALLVGGYGLWRLGRRGELRRARSWAAPLLGAAPAALGLGLWNWACFGSPFSLGYENLAVPFYRSLHAQGLVGVHLPRPDVVYYLTAHPARGLFVGAPVLLLALPGLWAMARRPRWRAEAVLCGAIFLSFLLVNAGFGLWWGGFTYTARHLVPAVPFLVLPLAFLSPRWRWAAIPLAVVSAVQSVGAAFNDPFTHDGLLMRLLVAARRSGELMAWDGWTFGRQVWPSLTARSVDGDWLGFAPNGGLLLGLHGPASLLPFLAIVLGLLWAAARPVRARRAVRSRAPLGTTPAREGAT